MSANDDDNAPLDFTFTPYNYKDSSWYEHRELGQPDDPYNKNCKKIPKSDPRYAQYLDIGRQLCDQLEKDILTNEDDGWTFVQDKDVCFFEIFFFVFFLECAFQGVVTHKKENEGSSILTFKGCTIIPTTPEILRLWLIQVSFFSPLIFYFSLNLGVVDGPTFLLGSHICWRLLRTGG